MTDKGKNVFFELTLTDDVPTLSIDSTKTINFGMDSRKTSDLAQATVNTNLFFPVKVTTSIICDGR